MGVLTARGEQIRSAHHPLLSHRSALAPIRPLHFNMPYMVSSHADITRYQHSVCISTFDVGMPSSRLRTCMFAPAYAATPARTKCSFCHNREHRFSKPAMTPSTESIVTRNASHLMAQLPPMSRKYLKLSKLARILPSSSSAISIARRSSRNRSNQPSASKNALYTYSRGVCWATERINGMPRIEFSF